MLGVEARGREEEMRLPRLSREMWDGGESGEWSAAILLLYRKMDLGMFYGSYRIGIVWVIGLDWIGLDWVGMAWLGISSRIKWLAMGMEWRTHQVSPGPGGWVFFGYLLPCSLYGIRREVVQT